MSEIKDPAQREWNTEERNDKVKVKRQKVVVWGSVVAAETAKQHVVELRAKYGIATAYRAGFAMTLVLCRRLFDELSC